MGLIQQGEVIATGPPIELILALAREFNIRALVETGTYQGTTTQWAAEVFEHVWTIDASEHFYQKACAKFSTLPQVTPLWGDSRQELAKLLPQLQGATLFWLDAHWSGGITYGEQDECPLLAELQVLQPIAARAFILIDDARLFLAPPPLPHQAIAWPSLTEVMRALMALGHDRYVAMIEDVIISVPAMAQPLVTQYGQQVSTRFWQAFSADRPPAQDQSPLARLDWHRLGQKIWRLVSATMTKHEAAPSTENAELSRQTYIQQPLPIQAELLQLFSPQKPWVIFDIGSCEGEDTIRYARLFPHSRIYSIEALPANVQRLREQVHHYGLTDRVHIWEIALWHTQGTAEFHVSAGQPSCPLQDWDFGNKSSSLLAPDQHLEVFPWLRFEQVITVHTDTLANLCRDNGISSIDFIHLDVQGAELQVLRGSGDLLQHVKAIWLEVEEVSLYQGQPLKQEVEAFMRQHHFVCLRDQPTLWKICGDQLYVHRRYLLTHFWLLPLWLKPCWRRIQTRIQTMSKHLAHKLWSLLAHILLESQAR